MPSLVYIRGGGLAAVLAGVLFTAWGYIHRDNAPAHSAAITSTLSIIVPLLFLLALVGLYALCKGQAGWLAAAGFIFGGVGSLGGVVHGAADLSCWYAYIAGKEWLSLLLDWLSLLLTGLVLVGIATVGIKVLRFWGALLLAMGILGWAYSVTDTGNFAESRPIHIAFGILFSVSWVTLGCALCQTMGTAERGDLVTRMRRRHP